VHPHRVIGTSDGAEPFESASWLRRWPAQVERPIICLFRNHHLAEARPGDLLDWTDGRALVPPAAPSIRCRVGGNVAPESVSVQQLLPVPRTGFRPCVAVGAREGE